MRTVYTVRPMNSDQVLASITLYGDMEPEIQSALLTMIYEASAICLAETGREAVVVERFRAESAGAIR